MIICMPDKPCDQCSCDHCLLHINSLLMTVLIKDSRLRSCLMFPKFSLILFTCRWQLFLITSKYLTNRLPYENKPFL